MTRTERKYMAAMRRYKAAWRKLRRVGVGVGSGRATDWWWHKLRVAMRARKRTRNRAWVLHVRLARIERRAR